MLTVVHDGTFEGWLTSVFEIYENRFQDVKISNADQYQKSLFGTEYFVTTDETKAHRVWQGLAKKVSPAAVDQVKKTWLSEIIGSEDILLSYIQYALSSQLPVEKDFSHPAVIFVADTAKKVHREKHRMEAFIRFQLTKDQLFYAIIEPDFNVLPLILKHFKARYADQRWMIYDSRRKYGLYYDLQTVESIQVNFESDTNSGKDITGIYDEKENLYQHLWKTYFGSVNISARKNMKLHIQHMPKRYWKYLTEK